MFCDELERYPAASSQDDAPVCHIPCVFEVHNPGNANQVRTSMHRAWFSQAQKQPRYSGRVHRLGRALSVKVPVEGVRVENLSADTRGKLTGHSRRVMPPRSEDTRLNSSHSSISYAVFC